MKSFGIVASTAINAFELLRQTHGYSLVDLWEATNKRLGITPQGVAVALVVAILFDVGLYVYAKITDKIADKKKGEHK